ncbi:unnamed protein product [Diamesa tonsa]
MKPSAFMTFLMEYKNAQAKKGKFMSMLSAQEAAGILWNNLDDRGREKYKKEAQGMSKDSLSSNYSQPREKLTSQGVPFSEIDSQKRLKEKKHDDMITDIENMLQKAMNLGTLETQVFYFISTSHFTQDLSGDIMPAELAMSKFSVREGIIDSFQILINPGPLPLGSTATAIEHAESTHNLPLPPDCEGFKCYVDIFDKILDFVDDGTNEVLPVMFTETGLKNDEIRSTDLVLKKILYETCEPDLTIKLYPLYHLFHSLREKCLEIQNDANDTEIEGFSSCWIAKDILERDPHRHAKIGCAYHETIDYSSHCCLSKVLRWGYDISKYCADLSQYSLVPGKHLPEDYVLRPNDLINDEMF